MSLSIKNRSSSLFVSQACLLLALGGSIDASQTLPVFLADNHAETFGWISRTFDPDARYQLVLVDAHSDASMAERSEEIRENLRRVPSAEVRAERVEQWRQAGRIQAFNWIEPLMPRPLDQVLWLAAPELSAEKRAEMNREATESLDGRIEVEPRSAGSLAERWRTLDLIEFSKWEPAGKPVILAIDLDFFAGMEASKREAIFETIWQRAMDWPGLAGVAFCVSRPWLSDDAEADALVNLACDTVSRTRGTMLEIDASLDDRPDHSLKASQSPTAIPRWDAEKISIQLRSRWLAMRGRFRISDRKRDWPTLLDGWNSDQIIASIEPERGEMDCDGVWRFPFQDPPTLRIAAPIGSTGRVRWFILEPARAAYDLLPETGLGKTFSSSPGRWIYEKRHSLGVTQDLALAAATWRPATPGQVRVIAEVQTQSGWITTAPIELRLSEGKGFHAALSECFRMPYVFGIAGVREGDLCGVETSWGSDCANFPIAAWRRNGLPFSWGDPGRLRAQLATKAENITLAADVSFSTEEMDVGIVIDFGHHVAALWEDRPPMGKLGGNDLVAHHLGSFPEIVELATLARDRPHFSVRTPRRASANCAVKIAGDVVLAGEASEEIPGFEKGDAAFFMANLEGVPSLENPDHPPRYDFRFPPERLTWLRQKGIDAVSIANNHCGDAGRTGLEEAIQALRQSGIAVVGAGTNSAAACKPWRSEHNGVRIAVFGVSLVETLTAEDGKAGAAKLPEHSSLLEAEMRRAKEAGENIIVLVHGGDEYQQRVNDDQRKWARWLVARGATLVVGAHPHVIQRTESHGGAIIAYSLGNAVYPKTLKGADSGEIRSFRLP